VDDTSTVSLVITNRSAAFQAFEFGVPLGSWLQVTPRVGQVAPGQSLRLQVEFGPPASLLPPAGAASNVAAASAAAPASSAERGSGGARDGVLALPQREPEHPQPQQTSLLHGGSRYLGRARSVVDGPASPLGCGSSDQWQAQGGAAAPEAAGPPKWRLYRRWVLPCYVKALELEESCSGAPLQPGAPIQSKHEAAGSGWKGSAQHGSSATVVLHLETAVCAVAPELVIEHAGALPRPAGKNYYTLEFGALPVGARGLQTVTLRNNGRAEFPILPSRAGGAGNCSGMITQHTALQQSISSSVKSHMAKTRTQ
jgi:hypothetical protein